MLLPNVYEGERTRAFSDGQIINLFFNPAERAGRMNYEIYHKLDPYLVRGMPAYAAKEGDVTRMNDLGTVLGGMVSTEVTRFITGARPLTDEEFAVYGGELSAAGYDEYCRTGEHGVSLFGKFRGGRTTWNCSRRARRLVLAAPVVCSALCSVKSFSEKRKIAKNSA